MRKSTPAATPFDGYWLYGPVLNKKEGRRYVSLVKDGDTKTRTIMSYARYLMSVHLGRLLTRNEEVDHKDNNKLNDVIENFQLLSTQENKRKYNGKGVKTVRIACPECGKVFERRVGSTHLVKKGSYTACSRSCNGKFSIRFSKYGASVPSDHVIEVYYKKAPTAVSLIG